MASTNYQKTNITETAPDWSANGVDPPPALKSQGFLSGYKPPAAYFNWFWTKVSVLLSQLCTVVNKIQDYLHDKCFYIRYDVGEMTSVGYLVSLMTPSKAKDESVILYFYTGYNLFRDFGIPRGEYGELNCKLEVITFPKQGVILKYNRSRGLFEKVDSIAERSISITKIDAVLHTGVYHGQVANVGELSDMIAYYPIEDDEIKIVYFDVSSVGSLRSITHNANFGSYNSFNNMITFDNGYCFVIEEGSLIQKTKIYASAIVDGTITKDKFSAELKAELGLT